MNKIINYLRYYIGSKKRVHRVSITNDINGLLINIVFNNSTYITTTLTERIIHHINKSRDIIEIADSILNYNTIQYKMKDKYL